MTKKKHQGTVNVSITQGHPRVRAFVPEGNAYYQIGIFHNKGVIIQIQGIPQDVSVEKVEKFVKGCPFIMKIMCSFIYRWDHVEEWVKHNDENRPAVAPIGMTPCSVCQGTGEAPATSVTRSPNPHYPDPSKYWERT